MTFRKIQSIVLAIFIVLTLGIVQVEAAIASGYSEYYIPGDEDVMNFILNEIGQNNPGANMHTVITVTVWADQTTIYYDHWENGYGFDPADPSTADETYVMPNRGDVKTFESANIPTPRQASQTYYDGRDRIYIAGGQATVSRASWAEATNTNLSLAWEVYPVKPQLTVYVLPFGEDLANGGGPNLQDFERVYALIQATANNTVVTVDFDGDGNPDWIDDNRDGIQQAGEDEFINLNAGEVYRLDKTSNGTISTLNTGTRVESNQTVQVQYIIGDEGSSYEIRGLSAFPRGFWDKEYFAPTSGGAGTDVDIYLYNPHTTSLTVNYDTTTNSGAFSIPATTCVSFQAQTGFYVPQSTAVQLKASDVFWGISTIDTSGHSTDNNDGITHDWAYSLVPTSFLMSEHFMGWAPGSYPVSTGSTADDSGVFMAAAQDNIQVFVDYDNDGTVDRTFGLDRLQSEYIYDAADGDMSGAHIYATGPYTANYGQHPDISQASSPALDVGYTTIPTDLMNLVMMVKKTANPTIVPTPSGSTSVFRIVIDSQSYTVDGVTVVDTLPTGWQYVAGSTTITLADKTQLNGASADPDIAGQTLTWWNASNLGNMAANQQIIIEFTGQTTQAFNVGDLTRHPVEVTGTRTVQLATQTFVTEDAVYVSYGEYQVDKTTAGVDPLSPGESYTYTVSVTNPPTAPNKLTGIAIYDPIPNGTTYVAGSSGIVGGRTYTNARDNFSAINYGNNDGNINWAGNWIETYDDGLPAGTPGVNRIFISNGELYLSDNPNSNQRPRVIRPIDLSAYSYATLSFDYRTTAGVDANDRARIRVYNGASWRTLETITNITGASFGSRSYDISADISNNTQVRFMIRGGYDGANKYFVVDNVKIEAMMSGGDYRDNFGAVNYNNSNGTLNWAGNSWVENNDDGNPGSGNIGINGGQLYLNDSPDSGSTPGVARTVNLAAYDRAILSFDAATSGNEETSDQVTLEISRDGVVYETVAQYNGDTNGAMQYDISKYISGSTSIRFRVTSDYGAGNENFYIDNLDVQVYTGTSVGGVTAGDPANFIDPKQGVSLLPGESLTLTFDVTVDDPLPSGLDTIVNTASVTTNEFAAPLSAQASNTVFNPSAQSAQVGGRVWFDEDGDGVSKVTETGFANVTVTLKDEFGAPKATAITNGNGYYQFTGITPGSNYYVHVTGGLPSGLVQTAPAGHSDDKSDPFTLTAGQNLTDVNLGYKGATGTATIGDRVWHDADGDTLQDLGEPGLSSVVVDLYWDQNNNGVFEIGTDPLFGSQTTNAGDFLFTGVTADGARDYFLRVDPTQAALVGYTQTTPVVYYIANLNGGDSSLTRDFGFQNTTTYFIKDRVWHDVNRDQQDDGELGISGVTVDLLDSSMKVLAGTTSDANGYFQFTGLVGNGADYTIRITDTSSKLVDYFGITSEATAGEMAINNLNSDLDYTVEPTEPNYGYDIKGAVGGTVFSDIDGSTTQDASEPGMSGVSVQIYRDVNDNGVFEPGGADGNALSTVSTDANGQFFFAALSDGTYFATIDETQGPLSGYALTTTDDEAAAGHQQQETLSGGNSNLNAIFGYQAIVLNTVSGKIWQDDDENGTINGSETGFENVTVDLLRNSVTVASTNTDSGGDYSFAGLTSDTYTVKVTDTNGVLNGFGTTYEKTEGVGASSYNGWEDANTTDADIIDLNFGYKNPQPTCAVVIGVCAKEAAGAMVVEWQTASEVGTVGFDLLRQDPSGNYVKINNGLLPGLQVSPQGGLYRFVDSSVRRGEQYSYKIIETEADGGKRFYGPYLLRFSGDVLKEGRELPGLYSRGYSRTTRTMSRKKRARLAARAEEKKRGQQISKYAHRDCVKVKIEQNGVYFLRAVDIAALWGNTVPYVMHLIKSGHLSLYCRGKTVAYLPAADNSGISFYGQKVESMFTNENIYWLKKDWGAKMVKISGESPQPVPEYFFPETIKVEENKFANPAITQDPDSDYWLWDYLFVNGPPASKEFAFRANGVAAYPGQARLQIRLRGGSNTRHCASIYINDSYVGEGRWSKTDPLEMTFSFPQSTLKEGDNVLKLTGSLDSGVPYSVFYLNDFEIDYQRAFRATDDILSLKADGNPIVTVTGFGNSDIVTLDIGDANMPKIITDTTIDSDGASFRVSFCPPDPSGNYLVFSRSSSGLPPTMLADTPSNLKSTGNHSDYLVITTAELVRPAERLVAHRGAQGLKGMVIDIEDIYDEFGDGMGGPNALKDFLDYARANWSQAPAYVVLAGEGSYDYKNYMGYDECLVPTKMVATPNGLCAADNALADGDGDGVPEIAIGRLPVLTASEFESVVDKIIACERSSLRASRFLFLADNPDLSGDYSKDSDQVAAFVPQQHLEKAYLGKLGLDKTRKKIIACWNAGVSFVNYLGHASVMGLAHEGMLKNTDLPNLTGNSLPIMTALSCVAGNHALPGYDVLGELLVIKPQGGAAAYWGPTGLCLNSQAKMLNRLFYHYALDSRPARLGDAVLGAMRRGKQEGLYPYIAEICGLIGDPAMKMPGAR